MLQSVTPTEDLFSITWNLGPRCNFECSYCPPRLHNKVSKHADLATLILRWEDIVTKTTHRNKRYKISFTGGEVSLNPNFLPFLEWLKKEHSDSIASIGFTTNGSASKRFYNKAIQHADWISFSSHFEFANPDKLWNNILNTHMTAVRLKRSVYVNIMAENRTEADMLQALCQAHRIPHGVNEINWEWHAKG